MQIEVKNSDRIAEVNILEKAGTIFTIQVDERVYTIDLMKVRNGYYSMIIDGQSYTIESAPTTDKKNLNINTFNQQVEIEIVDAETQYQRIRLGGVTGDMANQIIAPMPGKVVDVLVAEGDSVTEGQTLVIVSAMKMESEYKAGHDGRVKSVLVKSGDTVDSNQVMIELED